MKLHTGKSINDGLAHAYADCIQDLLRMRGLKGALAMGDAVRMAHDPKYVPMERELDLLKKYDILQRDGSMNTEMQKFILACTKERGRDFRLVDPRTGK